MRRPKPINLGAAAGRHVRPSNRSTTEPPQTRAWYRISNSSDGTAADVSIFDEIGYWGVTAADFIQEINALDVASLTVHINSPGGDVYDGVAIYNALLAHAADVTTSVEGLAASIGSVIAQAGSPRIVARASQMMIHEPFAGCVGNAADMREAAGMLDKVADMLADVYAARAGGTPAMWRKAMAAETWYSSDEAVQAGLADAVRGAASQDSFDLSTFKHAGRDDAPRPPLFDWNPGAVAAAIREALV